MSKSEKLFAHKLITARLLLWKRNDGHPPPDEQRYINTHPDLKALQAQSMTVAEIDAMLATVGAEARGLQP
jgi:hypothetical protein